MGSSYIKVANKVMNEYSFYLPERNWVVKEKLIMAFEGYFIVILFYINTLSKNFKRFIFFCIPVPCLF